MGELREVTIQYTNCADPIESAARKRRVLQGEAKGLMAETAPQMIEAITLQNQLLLEFAEDFSVNPSSMSQDLPFHPSSLTEFAQTATKRKRGRPPLRKSHNKSPLCLLGAKSSKRNKCLVQGSPKRKSTLEKGLPAEEENSAPSKNIHSNQNSRVNEVTNIASSSRTAPKGRFIPAIVKKKVDFQNPPNPLP